MDNDEHVILRISPGEVKQNMISCNTFMTKNMFINNIKAGTLTSTLNNKEKLSQCSIYFNQLGAGTGKTFRSIQLLQKDERFKDKKTIIYLTKMHTAKDVTKEELESQINDGQLKLLDFKKNNEGNIKTTCCKKYFFSYQNLKTGNICDVVMGTIE